MNWNQYLPVLVDRRKDSTFVFSLSVKKNGLPSLFVHRVIEKPNYQTVFVCLYFRDELTSVHSLPLPDCYVHLDIGLVETTTKGLR